MARVAVSTDCTTVTFFKMSVGINGSSAMPRRKANNSQSTPAAA